MATIVISGGFDPIHRGHIDLIKAASRIGQVIVVVNSDEWLIRKKGKPFMSWDERVFILENIVGVHKVEYVEDNDGTVCEALRRIKPDFFANGGDRTSDNTPELEVCEELGIVPLFEIGGQKTQSSSQLLKNYVQNSQENLGIL